MLSLSPPQKWQGRTVMLDAYSMLVGEYLGVPVGFELDAELDVQ